MSNEPRKQLKFSSDDLLNNTTKCFLDAEKYFNSWIASSDLSIIQQSEEIAQAYVEVSKQFWTRGQSVEAAIAILLHGSDQFAHWQKEHKTPVLRGTLFSELSAIHFHILDDLGGAIWWSLHTLVDSTTPDDAATNMLQARLGVSHKAIKILLKVKAASSSPREQFAEDVISRFVVEYPEFGFALAQNSIRTEFPLSMPYYELLLEEVKSKKDVIPKEKGNALERLASYLFLLIPGCIPRRNAIDNDRTYEIDLVVRNLHPNINLIAEVFGRHFLVECKNWVEPVGSREVGYFLHKIHLMHASFGVLFARSGITGELDEKAATQLIRRTFHEDGTLCIVISEQDLLSLKEGEITFRSLLFKLAEDFRFGKHNRK